MKNENPKSKFSSITNRSRYTARDSPSKFIDVELVTRKTRAPFLHARTDLGFDEKKLNQSMKTFKESLSVKRPDDSKLSPPKTLNINRKLSRSSNEIEEEKKRKGMSGGGSSSLLTKDHRSNSEKDLTFNMVSSQSENALRSLKNIANVITSPASATKDMLSPFSKFAKGVHNLGVNFDPRKLKGIHLTEPSYRMTEYHLEEIKRLEERWKKCNVKLIAL